MSMMPSTLKTVALTLAFFPFTVLAADIDVMDKQRQEPPTPKSQPPVIVVDDAQAAALDQSLRFTLGHLKVEGTTVFSGDELSARYRNLYGQETSFAQINAIAAELTKIYRDAGYLLSRVIVPAKQGELDPKNAHVRLVALEGYVGAVNYEGEPEAVERFRRYWSSAEQRLLAQKPLRHADFEREILLLSDLPGLRVSSRFEEGKDTGASTLILTVSTKPFDVSVSAGNTGTESAGRGIITLSASLNSLPFVGGRTTLSYTQAARREEYASVSLAHTHQFSNGLSLSASWAKSDSPEPDSDFARRFDYETASETVTVGLGVPFLRRRDLNLSASLNYEHRNSESELLGSRYTRDRLRALSLEVNFDISDEWGGVTQIIPTLTRGLPWDATDRDPDASAPQAPARFTRAKLYLSRNQSLPKSFSLFAAAEAQTSNEPLSSYHRISLGGNPFGRAYPPGIIENDKGAALSIEGRWSTNLVGLSVQPFVFVDWGTTRSENDHDSERIASSGLGLRLSGGIPGAPGRFNLTLFAARAAKDADKVEVGDRRYMLQTAYTY